MMPSPLASFHTMPPIEPRASPPVPVSRRADEADGYAFIHAEVGLAEEAFLAGGPHGVIVLEFEIDRGAGAVLPVVGIQDRHAFRQQAQEGQGHALVERVLTQVRDPQVHDQGTQVAVVTDVLAEDGERPLDRILGIAVLGRDVFEIGVFFHAAAENAGRGVVAAGGRLFGASSEQPAKPRAMRARPATIRWRKSLFLPVTLQSSVHDLCAPSGTDGFTAEPVYRGLITNSAIT